ncbi:MarR family transcriptional regulator [Nocardia neocaledoniensis]|uniref:MarR family transcriptional regulator n=1 Tax=Nocardia neocaledoniensis TaxID=236511 RepID=UPI00245541E8|nr:MarR family transcriptional regulator [Nocardia neocaledoniensis]
MVDSELAVMRALRLKGRATIDGLATATGLPTAEVESVITTLAASAETREIRGAHMLLPSARERLDALLVQERAGVDSSAAAELYERFNPVNADFKSLALDWQTCGEEPNDHLDAQYDERVLARLPGIHERITPIIDRLGELVSRLALYGPRLQTALNLVQAGESEWLLKPIIDSYHTVWFELHEELIHLAGRNRLDEATAGRAY